MSLVEWLAAAFALGDAACWLGIWIPCLKGPGASGQGLLFRQGSGKRFPASRRSSPRQGATASQQFFLKVQKPEGLGLGLAAAFALGCCVLVGDLDPLQKTSDQPRLKGQGPGGQGQGARARRPGGQGGPPCFTPRFGVSYSRAT